MILNLLNKSFSFLKGQTNFLLPFPSIGLSKLFSNTLPKRGLDEFFEDGKAYPIYDQEKKVIYGNEGN